MLGLVGTARAWMSIYKKTTGILVVTTIIWLASSFQRVSKSIYIQGGQQERGYIGRSRRSLSGQNVIAHFHAIEY